VSTQHMDRSAGSLLILISPGCESGWTGASWTWYNSYAACCENNTNYDPDADTTECDLNNDCAWPGWFAYAPDQKSYDWVRSHDIVAFFSSHGDNAAYGNKRLRIKARNVTLEAEVLAHQQDQTVMEPLKNLLAATNETWVFAAAQAALQRLA